jgi:hypothetical protein
VLDSVLHFLGRIFRILRRVTLHEQLNNSFIIGVEGKRELSGVGVVLLRQAITM